MPLILRPYTDRATIRACEQQLFVFGDNLERKGLGGQAKEHRGEPNAIGLPTKRTPGLHPSAFFKDSHLPHLKYINQAAIFMLTHWLKSGLTVNWPTNGIGTGLAALADHAPAIRRYYDQLLAELKEIR